MLAPPELRRPVTMKHSPRFEGAAVRTLNNWARELDFSRERHGFQLLPKGLNLHASSHLREMDHILEVRREGLETLLLNYWRRTFPDLDAFDLRSYRETHLHFETLWTHEPLDWVLEVVRQIPDATPEPEWVVGEWGESYWVRKFDEWPSHSLERMILRTVLERAKYIVDEFRPQNYGNETKHVAMKGRPFWVFALKPETLTDLTVEPVGLEEGWPPGTSQVLVVHEPINSAQVNKQDLFVSLVTIGNRKVYNARGDFLHWSRDVAEGCPTLQIPYAVRDNPEMEVRDAMKLYLSAGAIKNRRIVLEFNKFTTYYAETFGLRHAPVKGGATRYLMGQERAHLHINASPHNNHDYLEIRVEFATEASKAFYGRLVTFLGAFWQHCTAKFGEDLKVDMQHSELVDAGQIEVWGHWAYGEVTKRYPNLTA